MSEQGTNLLAGGNFIEFPIEELGQRRQRFPLLELYVRPISHTAPVICIDEKSLQLIGQSQSPLLMDSRSLKKVDYEYLLHGTTNLLVAIKPKAGQRTVSVTEFRGKVDFVALVCNLLTKSMPRHGTCLCCWTTGTSTS